MSGYKKMYIAVLEQVPDFMTPTLVAHSVLSAHLKFQNEPSYKDWIANSYSKVVVRVNQKEFDKIAALPEVYLGHENKTLDGVKSCVVVMPMIDADRPNVIKFAQAWNTNPEKQVAEMVGVIGKLCKELEKVRTTFDNQAYQEARKILAELEGGDDVTAIKDAAQAI